MCKFRVIREYENKLNRLALAGEMRGFGYEDGTDLSEDLLNETCDKIEEYLAGKTLDLHNTDISFLEKEVAKRGYDFIKGNNEISYYFSDILK